MFSWKRKRLVKEAKKEAEIQSVQKETLQNIDDATKGNIMAQQEIDKLLKNDVTLRIFYATGGARRTKQ